MFVVIDLRYPRMHQTVSYTQQWRTIRVTHNGVITNMDSEQCSVCVCVPEYKKYSGISHEIRNLSKMCLTNDITEFMYTKG